MRVQSWAERERPTVPGVHEPFVECQDEAIVFAIADRRSTGQVAAHPEGVVVAAETDVSDPQVVEAETEPAAGLVEVVLVSGHGRGCRQACSTRSVAMSRSLRLGVLRATSQLDERLVVTVAVAGHQDPL